MTLMKPICTSTQSNPAKLASSPGRPGVSRIAALLALMGLATSAAMAQPCAFTTYPPSQTVCNGQTVTLTAVGNGSNNTYYWLRNGSFLNNGNALSQTLTFTASPETAGVYQAEFFHFFPIFCQLRGPAITVNVLGSSITQSPVSTQGVEGGVVTLRATVSGTPTSYQWRKNGLAVPNSNSPTLRVGPLTAADSGSYDVVVFSGGCAPRISTVAIIGLETDLTNQQYARFLRGLSATEIVRSKMASTPNPRLIAVLAAISEVSARNKNMTAAQLSAFVAAYSAQLSAVYPGDPNLLKPFNLQPAVRYLTRVTTVVGLDTDVGEAVANRLDLRVDAASRQLRLIEFQNASIPRLASGDSVALMLQDIFGGRDFSGEPNPLVEAQAATLLRAEGIEPYPTPAVMASQFPEVVRALGLMPPNASAFEAERATGFAGLRAKTLAEFSSVSGFINGKIATLGTLTTQYPTLASTEIAAGNPTVVNTALANRASDIVALNQSRAAMGFTTAGLFQGSFIDQKDADVLRSYGNTQIQFGDTTSATISTGLVGGGSILAGFGSLFTGPGGAVVGLGMIATGVGQLLPLVLPGDNTPSPYQQLSDQITGLQNQMESLRVGMNDRFDRVDAGLNSIYASVNSGFAAMVSYFMDTSISLQNIQTQLAVSQSNINRFEQNLYGILDAGFNADLLAQMETAIGYRDRIGIDLSLPAYADYEGSFYSAAVNDSKDALRAGPDSLAYDNTGETQLANFPLGYNINALRAFPQSTLGQAPLGVARVANPTRWSLNADAYAQFARENPWYNARTTSNIPARLGDVLSTGQATQTVLNASRRQNLFDRLVSDHSARADTLQAAIDNAKANYLSTQATAALNMWGGPAQSTPFVPPVYSNISDRMSQFWPSNSSTFAGNYVVLPMSGTNQAFSILPAEYLTAMYLSLPNRGANNYTWTFRTLDMSSANGSAWNIDSQGTTYTSTIDVELWWNPQLLGQVNISGVGPVLAVNGTNVSSMQKVATRRFQITSGSFNSGWNNFPLSSFYNWWKQANGSEPAISGRFFQPSSVTFPSGGGGANPPRLWTATTIIDPTSLSAIRAEVNDRLRARQIGFYQILTTALGAGADNANVKIAADSMNITNSLIDSYASLGVPETLSTSDLLRGPLRGVEGIGRTSALRYYANALAAVPTTSGAVAPTTEPRVNAEFALRRGIFQRELNRALLSSRPAEFYPFMKWSLAGLTSLQAHALRLAIDDTYVTPPNTALIVPTASGLLANDADQPAASVTVVLVSPPSIGTLVLDSNLRGGFRYTPPAGFTGSVSFSYRARADLQPPSSNLVDSLPATVVIRVENCAATITQNPLNANYNMGGAATFTVAATSSTRASYQWRKNSVNLTDSPNLRGSHTPVLSLSGLTSTDQAVYSVAITTDCGTVFSSGASLGSVACSIADLAIGGQPADGIVDGSDFIAFINSFGIGDATIDPVADVTGDSIIDGSDFIAFINAFAAGC